jgi:hypothetical protein
MLINVTRVPTKEWGVFPRDHLSDAVEQILKNGTYEERTMCTIFNFVYLIVTRSGPDRANTTQIPSIAPSFPKKSDLWIEKGLKSASESTIPKTGSRAQSRAP